MKHDPKYRTLTPLRAVDLLTTLTDQGDTEWKLRVYLGLQGVELVVTD